MLSTVTRIAPNETPSRWASTPQVVATAATIARPRPRGDVGSGRRTSGSGAESKSRTVSRSACAVRSTSTTEALPACSTALVTSSVTTISAASVNAWTIGRAHV